VYDGVYRKYMALARTMVAVIGIEKYLLVRNECFNTVLSASSVVGSCDGERGPYRVTYIVGFSLREALPNAPAHLLTALHEAL
jgi:hypothetical protein